MAHWKNQGVRPHQPDPLFLRVAAHGAFLPWKPVVEGLIGSNDNAHVLSSTSLTFLANTFGPNGFWRNESPGSKTKDLWIALAE